ncbi:MAG: YitT family protein [Ruminococcus sp.]|nr:YitT family protein [Ruminococcus sp.]
MQRVKKVGYDIFVDILGGILAGVGIYSFAASAGFPLAGISGIALIFYRLFGVPIGLGTILLNIPIVLFSYKVLGRRFLLRSLQSIVISSLILDYVVPLFPVYDGNRMLAAVCTGVFSGLGYAVIFMNHSSTGGMDFVSVAIRKKHPYLSLGRIVFVLDVLVVLLGGLVFKDVDATIYGLIITYLLSAVIDKMMYGIDAGKMTLIVTDKGRDVAACIDQYAGRGSTIWKGSGAYSGQEKDVVMCACNNKQMYEIRKKVKEIDGKAFTIIMESNEVVGEGFKKE